MVALLRGYLRVVGGICFEKETSPAKAALQVNCLRAAFTIESTCTNRKAVVS